MADKDILTLRAASRYAKVSHETIRIWCGKYGIGDRQGEKWAINKRALDRVVKAKAALAALAAIK
jgi:hypothetical protein